MATCVGYMGSFSSYGLAECQQIVAAGGSVGGCVGHVLAGTATGAGKGVCTQAAVDTISQSAYLSDCLLGLSGQSHFGGTSCRIYWQSG